MKNTKSLFKIMAALMSLALVLGALFTLGAVSAGATEVQEREIIPVPDLPTFDRPYKTMEEIGIDFETIDAYSPQEIEVKYEDGKIYVEDIGAAYVSVSADKPYVLELVDGYWTAELEAEPEDMFIYVYSYETYMYDKHLSTAYNVDGIRDPYMNINDYINSVFITFSLEDENVTIQYKSENYYYEDNYEDGVLDTHGVSNIQDPEVVNDVFYGVDGKIRYCRLLTDTYYYYFPGQGWSDSRISFNACDAPAGYEDKDETYFAANKPSLICAKAEGDDIVHDMADATCTAPKTCKNGCGYTEGEALGHDFADANCTTPKTCEVCGETDGEALGHDFADADCTTPKTCEACGETDGEALGHNYGEWTSNGNNTHTRVCSRNDEHKETLDCSGGTATCTEQAVCETCKTVYGEALGHDFADADCTTPKTCEVCGETDGEALGHDMGEATCTAPATCKRNCGHTEGEALGHDFADADCTTPKTCETCGETDGEALGHDMDEATCTAPATCKRNCGRTEGEALGHDFADADCTTPKTCKTCNAIEGEALGHDYGAWTETKAATATEAGEKEKVCSVCGERITEAIPATGTSSGGDSSGDSSTNDNSTSDNGNLVGRNGCGSTIGGVSAGAIALLGAGALLFIKRKRK